jgi:hypothetical protein
MGRVLEGVDNVRQPVQVLVGDVAGPAHQRVPGRRLRRRLAQPGDLPRVDLGQVLHPPDLDKPRLAVDRHGERFPGRPGHDLGAQHRPPVRRRPCRLVAQQGAAVAPPSRRRVHHRAAARAVEVLQVVQLHPVVADDLARVVGGEPDLARCLVEPLAQVEGEGAGRERRIVGLVGQMGRAVHPVTGLGGALVSGIPPFDAHRSSQPHDPAARTSFTGLADQVFE